MAHPTLSSVGRGEVALLFALLLVLSTAAAFNYERNLRAERATRPYHVYNDRDLDRLIAGYREELADWQAKHRSARGAAAELAEREALLRDLEAEKRARASDGPELGRFLRRLVAI